MQPTDEQRNLYAQADADSAKDALSLSRESIARRERKNQEGEVHVDLSGEQWATVKAAMEGQVADLQAQLDEARAEVEQGKILAAIIREEAGEQEERANEAETLLEQAEAREKVLREALSHTVNCHKMSCRNCASARAAPEVK